MLLYCHLLVLQPKNSLKNFRAAEILAASKGFDMRKKAAVYYSNILGTKKKNSFRGRL